MGLALAFWSKQERGGIDYIAKWITAYPHISQITAVPKISDEYLWMWIVETPDPVHDVIEFYKDEKNLGNRRLHQSGRVIKLHMDKYNLMIMVSRERDGAGLIYKLSEAQKTDAGQ